jgi:hypothetical protein
MEETQTPITETPNLEADNASIEANVPDTSENAVSVKPDTTKEEIANIKALDKQFDDYQVEIVIDGEPVKMSVKELKAVKQKEVASNKRFQQAAEIEKKVKSFLERGKEVPEELLAKLGIDPEEFAESLLRKKIEEAKMSPEQRQAAEERKRFEEERKEWEMTVRERVKHEIDVGMTEAFKATGLPKQEYLMGRVAALVRNSNVLSQKDDRVKPLSFQEAAVKVKDWYFNDLRQTLKGLPLEERLKVLGDDVVEELMKYRLTQVGQPTKKEPAVEPAQAKPKQKPKKYYTPKEWRELVDSI